MSGTTESEPKDALHVATAIDASLELLKRGLNVQLQKKSGLARATGRLEIRDTKVERVPMATNGSCLMPKPHSEKKAQSEKFIDKARRVPECDEDEDRFNETLWRIAPKTENCRSEGVHL